MERKNDTGIPLMYNALPFMDASCLVHLFFQNKVIFGLIPNNIALIRRQRERGRKRENENKMFSLKACLSSFDVYERELGKKKKDVEKMETKQLRDQRLILIVQLCKKKI